MYSVHSFPTAVANCRAIYITHDAQQKLPSNRNRRIEHRLRKSICFFHKNVMKLSSVGGWNALKNSVRVNNGEANVVGDLRDGNSKINESLKWRWHFTNVAVYLLSYLILCWVRQPFDKETSFCSCSTIRRCDCAHQRRACVDLDAARVRIASSLIGSILVSRRLCVVVGQNRGRLVQEVLT